MTRKELYAKVKSMNLAEEIKKELGNYTRVSNLELEAFIAKKIAKQASSKKAKATKPKELDLKGAIVRLVSTLQAGCIISKADAEFVLKA